jgi:hypothetical protein
MITKETVFVLGAGASWHYGYPTGEGLIGHVIRIAHRLRRHCKWRLDNGNMVVQSVPTYVDKKVDNTRGVEGYRNAWKIVHNECEQLIARLETVRPLVIDYFLGWNESLRPIGKLMIAAAILECEARWNRLGRNINHEPKLINALIEEVARSPDKLPKGRDDWYRFIVHKLVYGCKTSRDIFKNKVHFITFNYDTSLEYHLSRALTSIDLFEADDIEEFLGNNRIVHVYGAVHEGVPVESDIIDLTFAQRLGEPPKALTTEWLGGIEDLLNRYHIAGEFLLTIDPHDKDGDKASLKLAKQWISQGEVVYILGYGFDPNNSDRIGLDGLFKRRRTVMFTNFGDINTVNKRASNQFFNDPSHFLESTLYRLPGSGSYGEKSVRTVYEAFEKDFDAVESE